jgi:hypothetical protein
VARRKLLGLGPRRLLQAMLLVAAAVALLLALTGVLNPNLAVILLLP